MSIHELEQLELLELDRQAQDQADLELMAYEQMLDDEASSRDFDYQAMVGSL